MRPKFRRPTDPTLRKYGLSYDEWEGILREQGWVCPICGKMPPSGRLVTDHEHVAGWKRMAPDDRKKYVRGITCWTCNRYFLARGMSPDKAANVGAYLVRYQVARSVRDLV